MEKSVFIDKVNAVIESLFPEKAEETAAPEVKMETYTLEDGTILEYASLEVEVPIFKIGPEGDQLPLESGDYVIADMMVKVVDGIITEVTEKETEVAPEEAPEEEMAANLKSELEISLKADYEAKLEALKSEYEIKLQDEKEKIKIELSKLAKEVSNTSIIQAPEIDNTPSKPLTKKDLILMEIEEKIAERNN